jgi:hypothetical protein
MGNTKTQASYSQTGLPSETAGVRNILTPFYQQKATQESPWYTDLASMYQNVLGSAQQANSYQVPQATQDILSQMVGTGMPYTGDITQSPIYQGAQKGYQSFVEPELANVREQQSKLGALRGSDTTRLEAEGVGKIGEQMMLNVIPQILADYQSAAGRQMQAITLQGQAQMYPAQILSALAQFGSGLEASQYPELSAATGYGTTGTQGSSIGYGYTPNFTGSCCITLLELGCLTDKVRELRDQLFSPDSYVAKGYKEMSKWLVPILKKHKLLKAALKFLMGTPIAKFSDNYNLAMIPVCLFWTISWSLYGRIKVAIS